MLMNKIMKFILACIISTVGSTSILAQDELPSKADPLGEMKRIKPVPLHSLHLDVPLQHIQVPTSFKGVKKNLIVDKSNSLAPFMEKLRLARADFLTDSVRVLHVGDSHIKGHFFTYRVRDLLQEDFSMLSYEDYGINGAVERTFNTPDRIRQIASFKPDLLILSFGTNTSNDRNYSSRYHYRELESLILQIRQLLPKTPILLTTPPGAFERLGRNRYRLNKRTDLAVNVIKECAVDHELAYWDLYNAVGGVIYAPTNWMSANLMRPDHIHFYVEGYELQGNLLYKAIIQHYNEYITP